MFIYLDLYILRQLYKIKPQLSQSYVYTNEIYDHYILKISVK